LFLLFWIIIYIFHTYPLLQSQYAAIALTTPCTSLTHLLLTKRVTFSQVLTLAPWGWFPCRSKHAGAFLSILECFNNSHLSVSTVLWCSFWTEFLLAGVTQACRLLHGCLTGPTAPILRDGMLWFVLGWDFCDRKLAF